ncbi:MFS transporter [Legionella clemsonensis]|uniref:Proline/betaine transporter n=1 Tax=Legionella clemsonensis TaxID=1867846 RepID=A0A222P0N9_9GAMM|nr:MFS transporter [Legionella clemsonensis]ASQ45396.1 Proline/betaine transporter [Legionella clemsonensis]
MAMVSSPSLHRIVIPGLLGNVLEWYDFALYGYFASTLTPLFFPAQNKTLALILTFTVFAIGFLMRPLGAIVFGYIGDRLGRKHALSYAILLMAIPTTLIGLLPDYSQIGIIAPSLLIVCRLLQGLAVGGEFTGSMVYLLEHTPTAKQGFYGSLAMASAFGGLLLGSAAATIVELFAVAWAWRIPFLLSITLGALGLYLRLHMPESPVFETLKKKHPLTVNPLKEVVSKHFSLMLKAMALVILPSTGFYLSFLYLTTYLNHFLAVALPHAMLINTLTLFLLMLACPAVGVLADKIGKWRILITGAAFFIFLSIPLYLLLQEKSLMAIFICQIAFACMVALSYSPIPAVLLELFPVAFRYTGLSLSYNLANALFGGTSAAVATSLIHVTGILFMPAVYLIFIATVTFVTLLKFKQLSAVSVH